MVRSSRPASATSVWLSDRISMQEALGSILSTMEQTDRKSPYFWVTVKTAACVTTEQEPWRSSAGDLLPSQASTTEQSRNHGIHSADFELTLEFI